MIACGRGEGLGFEHPASAWEKLAEKDLLPVAIGDHIITVARNVAHACTK